MRHESFYDADMTLYERCTLTAARRAYDAGEIIIIAPINASMHHGVNALWMPLCKNYWSCEGLTFKQVINNFEYYNLNQGAGNYTKYFIRHR